MTKGLVQDKSGMSSSSYEHGPDSGLVGRLLVCEYGLEIGEEEAEEDEEGEEGHESAGGKEFGVGRGGCGNGYVT